MYQVKFTSAFKKSYKRIKKRGLEMALLDEVIEKLRLGQTPRPRTQRKFCWF